MLQGDGEAQEGGGSLSLGGERGLFTVSWHPGDHALPECEWGCCTENLLLCGEERTDSAVALLEKEGQWWAVSDRPQGRLWALGWEDRGIAWGEHPLPLNGPYRGDDTGSTGKRSRTELRFRS